MTYRRQRGEYIDEEQTLQVGRDRVLEQEQLRGRVHIAPMFTLKSCEPQGSDIYHFLGSDMDADPLVK